MGKLLNTRLNAVRGQREAADQQPWRCVACGEAVNKTTKRDCRCTRAEMSTESRKESPK
jgi:hypothetical protein